MVEPQPSKLVAWVRFPSPAPFFIRNKKRLIAEDESLFCYLMILAQAKRFALLHNMGFNTVGGFNRVVGNSNLAAGQFFHIFG